MKSPWRMQSPRELRRTAQSHDASHPIATFQRRRSIHATDQSGVAQARSVRSCIGKSAPDELVPQPAFGDRQTPDERSVAGGIAPFGGQIRVASTVAVTIVRATLSRRR